ncbi:MAG TPA: Ppx/GppA phosphatase family protein [Gemmatimonadaceae bacterium]|nr:Ppx/GppA phosphatase family protein [Gemmatimonadaceae bacterium]
MTPSPARLTLSSTPAAEKPAQEIRIAAIDIGSNSIRQTIADVSPGGSIRVVDEMRASPRLGAGLDKTGKLSEVAIDNAIATLTRMATLARQQGAKRTEVVATSAVREASNGAAFLALVREHAGLKVRVLEGSDEARLSFLSALAHFDLASGRAVVMDIGGGSLEIALSAEGLVDRLISLPMGAIRMTEQFLADDTPQRGMRRLRKFVRKELKKHLSAKHWRAAQVISSGGTFTNLASIHLARHGMESARTVHGTIVPRVELEHIVDTLHNMSPSERQGVPGLTPARADIIVAGFAVAAEVLARLDVSNLVVSAYGIREGILLEAAKVTPAAGDPGEGRERSVKELAERSHFEEPHAKRVQRLALELFDAIGARLGAAPGERQILSDAALLHDIGYHINYDKHHKHSYHLIQHAGLMGMTPREQIAVANVARYHRGADPKSKHANFRELDSKLQAMIRRLAAILRVADGFDRGHAGAVEHVKVRWNKRALRITAVQNPKAGSMRLDLWGANRKSGLLSEVADAKVEIVAPDGSVMSYEDAGDAAD